ncbi:MAG: hypothetical protein ABIC40_03695, partial [bacterium]
MVRAYIAFTAILLAEILLLFLGCQGGNHNPIIPGESENDAKISADGTGTEVKTGKGAIANTPVIWGVYQAIYDPNTHQVETIPLRGACYAWNLVHFMQPPVGKANSLIIGVLDDSEFYSNGRIDVRIILHHPFPGQDIYTGFDVMGVFITEGSMTCPANENIRYADPEKDPTVLNPDGYTRWMNPAEFLTGNVFGYDPGIFGTSESSENSGFVMGATYNPYKYFALGLGPDENLASWLDDPENIANRGMFPSGATCSRDYEMNFPKIDGQLVFKFNYAIIANWAEPTVDPPDDPINDFPLKANAEYPLHIFVNDNSQVYYTEDDAGGTLSFDITVFDWDALSSPQGIPGEVSKIKIWSNDPLVPGGSIDVLSEEVEWNSGFTASLSTGMVEIPGAVPAKDGFTDVWFSIESTNPEYYDQGFGAKVPSDPIATNVKIPVEVKNCPKAFLLGMETNEACEGAILNDVQITGSDFVDGDDLSIWFEPLTVPDSEGEPIEKIFATDVQYVNESTVTADFDLANVELGAYGVGCKNGCGVETTPEENEKMFTGGELEFKVIHPPPTGLKLSTNRTTLTAATIDTLFVTWDIIEAAQYYNVYTDGYDITGKKVMSCKIGTTTSPYYLIPVNFFNIPSGMLEIYVTAASDFGNLCLESFPSKHGWFYFQRFENGLGN